MATQTVVIIGSGLAGYMAAKEIRKLNQTIELIILSRDAGRFYSKPQLSVALGQGKEASELVVSSAEDMALQLEAQVITHTVVTHVDRDKKQVFAGADRHWHYDQLVLALGADLIQPGLTGDAADQIISINDLQSYEAFRKSLQPAAAIAIIGAGLVGCEFANDFNKAGHDVSVIGLSDQPLERLLPRACASALQSALADAGVRWCLGDSAVEVSTTKEGRIEVVTAQHGSLTVDHVISAIGLRPHIGLAQAMSLPTAQGICVDRFLRTSDPAIYALGDCAEVEGHVRLFVAPILHCARALAKTLTESDSAVSFPLMPIIIKTSVCPIAVLPPISDHEGAWEIEGSDPNLCAKYFTASGEFIGFVLTGNRVKERSLLMKQLNL